MKKNLFLALGILSLAVACEKPSTDEKKDVEGSGIYDTFILDDVTTRASLGGDNNVSVSWDLKDHIAYLSGKDSDNPHNGVKKTVEVKEGNTITVVRPYDDDTYYILYHAGNNGKIFAQNMNNYSLTECRFYAICPDHGNGSFANAFVCGAKVDIGTTNIQMKPLTSLLEFKMLPRKGITKVVLKGNGSENINGRIQVDFSKSDCPAKFGKIYGTTNPTESYITFETDGAQGSHLYYFSVMPQTLASGYTLDFYGNDGTNDFLVAEVSNNNSTTFTQGKIKPVLQSSVVAYYPISGAAKCNDIADNGTSKTMVLDDNISLIASDGSDTQGYYEEDFYPSGETDKVPAWRLYLARGKKLTISGNNKTIAKMIINYEGTNGGALKDAANNPIESGVAFDVNANSKELTLYRNDSSTGSCQLNIISVKVAYTL